MRHSTSVTIGADEVWEQDAYEMETYELTQEDHMLAVAFRMNAMQAGRQPHHVVVHRAQRRAACLAIQVAEDETGLPRLSSNGTHDESYDLYLDSVVCGDEAVSENRSTLANKVDNFSRGEGNDLCSSAGHVSYSRDATVGSHGWNISTRFWKRYRRACAHVIPLSDASEAQSHSDGGRHEEATQTSRIRRLMRSIMRRTSREKQSQTTRFDPLFLSASSGEADWNRDSFGYATSDDFGDESVLPGGRDTNAGRNWRRSPSSLKRGLVKWVSRSKAVSEKELASATSEA
eukprot:TRINITY_DN6950_c0_g1_i1.p1 TRINITY_DN6950_c0_g1~~TRINITY_DN6950_c0_g1_i1.p1  ORF type:complete len:289 (-),score=23.76 TRINITY_DN6950_c0_g1_i1:484-1350(-)